MARKQTAKMTLQLPTITRHRKSYDERTGRCTRAAAILAKAQVEAPVFVEDDDGHRMRQWKPEELKRYTTDDIIEALRLRRAAEYEDLLETLPPQGIKYCVTKGWLFPSETTKGLYWVTRKAAAELDLPRKLQGRAIQFLDRGL